MGNTTARYIQANKRCSRDIFGTTRLEHVFDTAPKLALGVGDVENEIFDVFGGVFIRVFA